MGDDRIGSIPSSRQRIDALVRSVEGAAEGQVGSRIAARVPSIEQPTLPRLVSPADYPGLSWWVRSDRLITGDPVAVWGDLIAPADDAAAAAPNRPDYTLSNPAFNGHPTLDFDSAVPQCMVVPNSTQLNLTSAGLTVYAVFLQSIAGGGGNLLNKNDPLDLEWAIFHNASDDLFFRIRNAADTGNFNASGPNIAGIGAFIVRAQHIPNVSVSIRLNDGPEVVAAAGSFKTGGGSDMGLACRPDIANEFDGSCAEAFIYQNVIDATQDAAIYGYLSTRYAI